MAVAPPVITKSFTPPTIPLNGTSTLTFTITNPAGNTDPILGKLTGVGFTDTLPTGVTVDNPNGLSTTCGGTVTAMPGSGTVTLTGATLAVGASCTISVTVVGGTPGVLTNSVTVTSTNGGTGNTGTATLTVQTLPPVVTKLFGTSTVMLGGSTSLTFSVTNPNPVALTGATFTDSLPAGITVATPSGLTTSCGGTITATAGSGSITGSGIPLAATASCTVTVNVDLGAAGVLCNNITGIGASGTGPGTSPPSVCVTVIAPPTITKSFNPTTIPVNGTTTLTFTLTNPSANTVPLTGVNFVEHPAVGTCGEHS